MSLRLNNVRVRANDPRGLAQFWMRALNWTLVQASQDSVLIARTAKRPIPADALALLFVRTDQADPAEPAEPAGQGRLLFDLAPTDREAELQRLEELGATTLGPDADDERRTIMADPEGNRFCVLHTVGRLPAGKAAR